MNLILLFKNDFVSDYRVKLSGRRHYHIMNILRSSCGDELTIGLVNQKIGVGKIVTLDDQKVELDVWFDRDPPNPSPVTLLLALPRPLVFKRILQSITSIGVKKIIVFQSSRVEKSFWLSPVLRDEEIKQQLILGLEQAKDTIIPEVIFKKRFKSFVEDDLSDITVGKKSVLADPSGKKGYPDRISEEMVLAIGPEGGFVSYEIGKFKECGFDVFNLGKRILKVETVIPVLLSKSLG